MRFSGSLLSSFILFVSSFSPFGKVLSQIVATFLGLWKCGVTIVECAHVHSFAQSAWNVYNLPRTAAAEISTELDESWMCVCLRLILLQSLVSPAAPEISFPSALVVFSLSVSSESYLLSQGGKSSIGTCVHVKSVYLSDVVGIAWAVHHVGACAAHMLSKSGVRVFIVVQMHIISRHTHKPNLELQIVIVCP